MSAAAEAFEEPYQPVARTRAQRKKAGLGKTSWYVQDLLPKGRLINIAAPYSAGKTTLVVDIVAHSILGLDWREHKHQVTKRKPDKAPLTVMYVTAEGSIEPQLDAWEEHYELTVPDGQFVIYDEFSWDEQGEAQVKLEDDLNYYEPNILVFDTHNAVGFTEDNATLWSEQIAWLRMLMREHPDLTIIVIHHFGKDYGRGMRGLSAVAASADLIYEVTPVDASGKDVKVEDAAGFEFDRHKNRCGRRRMMSPVYYSVIPVHLGVDDWGDPATGAVIGEFMTVDGPERSKADEVYDIVKVLLADREPVKSKNALLKLVTEYAEENGISGLRNRSKFFGEILPALISAGLVNVSEDGQIALGRIV